VVEPLVDGFTSAIQTIIHNFATLVKPLVDDFTSSVQSLIRNLATSV
jgi:hypothetical protein